MTLPPICFYVPADQWPSDIANPSEYFWSAERIGKFNWTIQTCHHLRSSGFPCQMVKEIPDDGIVLVHRGALPDEVKPGKRQLFVCIQADRPPHPFAQLHLLQNEIGTRIAEQALRNRVEKIVMPIKKQHFFIRYWPQPELIPRDSIHKDRFQNVAYMGRAKNLAPELQTPDWYSKMESLGFKWLIVEEKDQWRDYSNLDAVLAVRRFDQDPHNHKPATKLYNAWHAGIPAVLGRDSAFSSERKSELDFLEVNSPEEVINALVRLREDLKLRQAMIENGHKRAEETRIDTLVNVWKDFLTEVTVPAYEMWCRQSQLSQSSYFALRQFYHFSDNFSKKIDKAKQKAKRVVNPSLLPSD